MSNRKWGELRGGIVSSYLAKLEQGGVELPSKLAARAAAFREKYPFTAPDDQSDEFIVFTGPVRDTGWGEEPEPTSLATFAGLTAAERVSGWEPGQRSMLRRLALSDPGAALDTLEEALARNLEDDDFWTEGISGLTNALAEASRDTSKVVSSG